MRRLISIFLLLSMKIWSLVFYRTQATWLNQPSEKWKNLRLFVFLNHTSLFEPLYVSAFPVSVLWHAACRMVVPGADKTLRRPIVGRFYYLLVPGMIEITRKRDHTWAEFLTQIAPHSVVAILPEGRMKRRSGLDSEGNPMSIRGGIADVLQGLESGNILFGYSGGLHHVQAPGDRFPRLFKTIRINFEQLSVQEYKKSLDQKLSFKEAVQLDMQQRLDQKLPCMEGIK